MNLKAILVLCVTTCVGRTAQAQFQYTVNADNTITITGYTGASDAVAVPSTINGLSVTGIGNSAFDELITLTSVTIPDTVSSVGNYAFYSCFALTSVTIPHSVTNIGNYAFAVSGLTSVTLPGSVTSIGASLFYDCQSLTNVTIPASVISIGESAFSDCFSLTNVTIPGSVTNIGDYAFGGCKSLSNVFFTGDAPAADSTVFSDDNNNPVVYYCPGASGWSSPFAGRQALLWNPLIQTSGTNFGVQGNQFGFNITGTAFIPVEVEACTNLASPVWTPLLSVILTNGVFYFSEPLQTRLAGRYFRVAAP